VRAIALTTSGGSPEAAPAHPASRCNPDISSVLPAINAADDAIITDCFMYNGWSFNLLRGLAERGALTLSSAGCVPCVVCARRCWTVVRSCKRSYRGTSCSKLSALGALYE
jgi:hypothetical protein